ncbi:hypothetical protein NS14008_22630 [Nocardia seriolae]|nr:hypothetical protein NS14008_22630 [Nocardia seriolae]RLP26460.1 hypothetical protein D6158_30875 [Nocardia seriolae]
MGLLPDASSSIEVQYHPALTIDNGEQQLLQPVVEIAWNAGGFVRISISVHEARALADGLTAVLAEHRDATDSPAG